MRRYDILKDFVIGDGTVLKAGDSYVQMLDIVSKFEQGLIDNGFLEEEIKPKTDLEQLENYVVLVLNNNFLGSMIDKAILQTLLGKIRDLRNGKRD